MWVSKDHYETLFENLTIERAKNSQFEARLSAMQATQDWLTQHVNRLENERAILVQARLGLLFPVPEISRAAPGVEPPPGIEGVPARDDSVTKGLPPEAIPLAQLMGASMEDLGDEASEQMGIRHDAQGFVHHR